MGRNFVAPAPDRLWTADITYLPTDEGFLYLAFILDVYSRKVVGWSMASHLRSELVAAALEMAISEEGTVAQQPSDAGESLYRGEVTLGGALQDLAHLDGVGRGYLAAFGGVTPKLRRDEGLEDLHE